MSQSPGQATETADPGGAGAAPTTGVRGWLASRSVGQLSRGAVLVVLAVTAAFGGMDTVDSGVKVVDPGTAFDSGPFSVTVERARIVSEVTAGERVVRPEQPGRRYLAVVATLASRGTTPVALRNQLDVAAIPDARWVTAIRIADSSETYWQGPGLTDQLAFVWSVPEDAVTAGETMTVRIWAKQFLETKVTYGRTWLDSLTDYARITLPVTEPTEPGR